MARGVSTQLVETMDLANFLEGLIYQGFLQICMTFDWRTGTWQVSWTNRDLENN